MQQVTERNRYILRVSAAKMNLRADCGAGATESCEKKEEILPGTTPRNRVMAVCAPR
jgi:hypothetical protein